MLCCVHQCVLTGTQQECAEPLHCILIPDVFSRVGLRFNDDASFRRHVTTPWLLCLLKYKFLGKWLCLCHRMEFKKYIFCSIQPPFIWLVLEYTASVIVGWVSVEHWWSDTVWEIGMNWGKCACPSVTQSHIEWNAPVSVPLSPTQNEMRMSQCHSVPHRMKCACPSAT